MSGIPFEQTRQGQMFYNGQLPAMIRNIEELNKNVAELTRVVKEQNELIIKQQRALQEMKENNNREQEEWELEK